jgi:hypothetical protein
MVPVLANNRTRHAEKRSQIRHRTEDWLGVGRRGGEHCVRATRAQGSRKTFGMCACSSTTAPNCSQPLPIFTLYYYLNYSAVLVRLSRVTPVVLRDLIGMAHWFVTADRSTYQTRHRGRKIDVPAKIIKAYGQSSPLQHSC